MTITPESDQPASLSLWTPEQQGQVYNLLAGPTDKDAAAGPYGAHSAEYYAVKWLNWLLNTRGRAKRTVRTYGGVLKYWFIYCHENHIVDPLAPTLAEQEAFLVRKRQRQGKGGTGSASSRHTDVTVLRGWFGWMHRRGYIRVNPTVELEGPTVHRKLPKPVDDAVWLQFWSLPPLQERRGPIEVRRLRTAVGLGYTCGFRRHEYDLLTGHHFSGHRLITNFQRKGGGEDTLPWQDMIELYDKTNQKKGLKRLFPNGEEFIDDVVVYAQQCGSGKMFWTDAQQMYKNMRKLCISYKLPIIITPHMLRHSCATNLIRMGVRIEIVCELLNHSDINITRGYIKIAGAVLNEFLDSL